MSFLRQLRLLLIHPQTADKFEAFRNLIALDNSQFKLQKVLCCHGYYQSWLYNTAKVFKQEVFSLSEIYLETDCGDLKWSEIRPEEAFRDEREFNQRKLIDKKNPFSERDSKRVNLLSTVLKYFEDPQFKEPIVIQGIAGAGKSSFTLRLAHELTEKGCTPIRVLLKDIRNLNQNLLESIPYALRFGEEGMDGYKFKPEYDSQYSQWLKDLIDRNEFIYFGDKKTEISPYVFIFDGWDEISTEAGQGFKDSIEKVLKNIRNLFIDQRRERPPIRIIVTGRPSVDVNDTDFLLQNTPILTLKPLTPTQLETYINKFQNARKMMSSEISVTSEELGTLQRDNSLESQYIETILNTYKTEFEELVKEHQKGNVSDIKGSLAVLGLPLLSYLTLRLLFKVESENELQALIHNPTNLYRALIDETCEGSGNPLLKKDLQQQNLYRLSGEKLRRLLWQTAQAVTATGKESISRNELKYRCGVQELESIVKEVTAENLLSCLIISFFFKENTGEGCEFAHKSFREYLFAEAIVEALKKYGRKAKTYEEREVLWKDFDESDPRYELTHNLSEQLAPCWLSPEVKTHILNILTWEIERSSEQLNPQTANFQRSITQPISFGQWGYVRDGLADVWDWWVEGVLMRPQPTVEKKKNKAPEYGFQPAYVSELVELCCPLDKSVWESHLPVPASLNLVDARLGDGFFHLTAIVHGRLYEYVAGQFIELLESNEPELRRRYQTKNVARKNESEKNIFLIQFAPGSLIQFSPFERNQKNFEHFQILVNRINGVETRPQGEFPSYVWGVAINLKRINLKRINLEGAYLERANLQGANLQGANLQGANLQGANLQGANLQGANLQGANLQGANLRGTYLRGTYLRGTNLEGANLFGAYLFQANLEGANLQGVKLFGAYLEDAGLKGINLYGARYLTVEQVKQADEWEKARYDQEMREKLGLT